MTSKTLVQLTLVGASVLAMAACAPRPAPQGSTDNQYAGGGSTSSETPVNRGNVGGGNVGGANQGPARGSSQDFVINVGDRVYFDFDSYDVRPEARPRLDAQAQWLQRYPGVTVRIEGNADERGTREYNIALGARRAEAVRSYLTSRGVAPARIDTISYGKERPIAQGSNEEAWARNRNAHTAIVSGAQ